MNIASNIIRGRRLFPRNTAITFEGRDYSYEYMDSWSGKIAAGLQSLGVCRGERIALLLPNVPEFAAIYLGCQKLGAVVVSISPLLESEEVVSVIKDCEPIAIFVAFDLRNKIKINRDSDHLNIIVVDDQVNGNDIPFESLQSGQESEFPIADMHPNDMAAILYTSGTTGRPKGICLSHGNVISNMYAFNHNCGMRPDDRVILFLPLSHCFGQNAILNSALNACATVVLHRNFNPGKIVESLVNDKVTMLFSVPTALISIYDLISPENMGSVRYFFSAAANLPDDLASKWYHKFGRQINQGYGLTETSPFACYNHSLSFRPNSIGSPIENVEMRVADPKTGLTVDIGVDGELLIRGPNVMLGYWNQPNETVDAITDGWLHTGDIGRMDQDGYFYIIDRLKDMVNIGGLKVYPAEVENVLRKHIDAEDIAVFGVNFPIIGERLCVYIICKKDVLLLESDIKRVCTENLAGYKVPSVVRFVDSLPKSPTGKVLKRQLRSLEEELFASEITKGKINLLLMTKPLDERKTLLESLLRDIMTSIFGKDSFKPIDFSLDFFDLGLDSLKAFSLHERLQAELDISLPINVVFEHPSLSQLLEYLIAEIFPANMLNL